MKVLLMIYMLANGQPNVFSTTGMWNGDEIVPFQSIQECSLVGWQIAADYATKHPGTEILTISCGPDRANN